MVVVTISSLFTLKALSNVYDFKFGAWQGGCITGKGVVRDAILS